MSRFKTLFTGVVALCVCFAPLAVAADATGPPQERPRPAVADSPTPGSLAIQILHASDLEGGVEAINDAPNFAAVVQALETQASNAGVASILLSAGDNYIPGPFYSAAGDYDLREPLRAALDNPDAREGDGRVDVTIMNILGISASALGNHEFDPGTNALGGLVATDIRDSDDDGVLDEPRWLGAQFPYLSSNLDFSADDNLNWLFIGDVLPHTDFQSPIGDLDAAAAAPKLAASTTIEAGGVTYGVVGGTTPMLASISSPGDTAVKDPGAGTNDMADLAAILQPEIDRLTALGIDRIILATHLQQIALEEELVTLLHDVDISIAGGSDTILADGDDRLRAGDTAEDTYPLITVNADGDPALIVSTDGQYKYIGRLVVNFDGSGVINPGSLNAANIGAYATDDQGVEDLWGNLVDPFAEGTKGGTVRGLTTAVQDVVTVKDGNVFGKTDVYLEGRREFVRTEQTNVGDFSADANLEVARSFDPTVAVSLKNGGGIRASIGEIVEVAPGVYEEVPPQANPLSGRQAGEISQLHIENCLKFNNGLTLITLTATQLLEVAEHAVAATEDGATPGQFCQEGGMHLTFDPTLPADSRVRTLELFDDGGVTDVVAANGLLIGDPDRAIRMVTLNFLAGGGDGYPFADFAALDPVFADVVDLTASGLPDGVAIFADAGSEQDALAEYLAAHYAEAPYAIPDTDSTDDDRIRNLRAANVDCSLSVTPVGAVLPITAAFRAVMANPYTGQDRHLAGNIELRLPDGRSFPNWRGDYAVVPGGGQYIRSWSLDFPALELLAGETAFTLTVEDVTPAPFNQPPYIPSGDAEAETATVFGIAP